MIVIMEKRKKRSNTSVWLVAGVAVLIILLIVWLTVADLWGDTDVAARAVMKGVENFNMLS